MNNSIKNETKKQYILSLKQRLALKAKVNGIIKQFNQNYCQEFVDKMNEFNRKVWDYSSSKPYVECQITKSKKFNFPKEAKPWNIHYIDTKKFIPNYDKIKQCLLKNLTEKEIEMIGREVNFYIKDKNIIDNVTIFKNETLCNRLNNEENNFEDTESKISFRKTRNIEAPFTIKENSEHITEEKYIKKLIELSKEKEKLKAIKQKEKNHLVDNIILKTKFELLNCDREIKEKHNKILLTLTKKSSDFMEKPTVKNSSLPTTVRNNHYKKFISQFVNINFKKCQMKYKSTFLQKKNNEIEMNNMIKTYSEQIKNNFFMTHHHNPKALSYNYK